MIWNEKSPDLRRVFPDKQTPLSIIKVINLRLELLGFTDDPKFSTLFVEGHYEIIKEAITALMLIHGYKTTSHEILIAFLAKFYAPKFLPSEILLLDQLRKIRNDIDYRGVIVKNDYWERNCDAIKNLARKIKSVLESEIK